MKTLIPPKPDGEVKVLDRRRLVTPVASAAECKSREKFSAISSSYLSGAPMVSISLSGPRNGKCRGPGILPLIALTCIHFVQLIVSAVIKQSQRH
jgi:hypothetical protein